MATLIFAQGLQINPRHVLDLFKGRLGLMLRVLVAVLVLVPAAALAILLGLGPGRPLAIAIAILVSCPPAPLMVSNAPKKGASAAFMAGLHLALSALAFVSVPAVLYLMSIPLGFKADVDLGAMGWILARTNLGPLALGLAVKGLAPTIADRIAPPLSKAGNVGVIVVVLVVFAKFFPTLLHTGPWSYLVIALVSVTSLAIGHFAGPDNRHERTSLAIECGVRHPALAIAIGTANFGAARTLTVLVPCVLTFIAVATAYLWLRGRVVSR